MDCKVLYIPDESLEEFAPENFHHETVSVSEGQLLLRGHSVNSFEEFAFQKNWKKVGPGKFCAYDSDCLSVVPIRRRTGLDIAVYTNPVSNVRKTRHELKRKDSLMFREITEFEIQSVSTTEMLSEFKDIHRPSKLMNFGAAINAGMFDEMTYPTNRYNPYSRSNGTTVTHLGFRRGWTIPAYKVTANESDTIRAIYFTEGSIIPDLIVHRESADVCYERIDPGAYLHITQSRVEHHDEATVQPYPRRLNRRENERRLYIQKGLKFKQEYVKRHIDGELDYCFVSMFKAYDQKLHYSDSVIEVEDPHTYHAVLSYLAGEEITSMAQDFGLIFKFIVKKFQDKNFVVNGVNIKYKKIDRESEKTGRISTYHYINGKRLSTDDVDIVINRVLCYPDNNDGYHAYVNTVSTMSLKFHRAIQEGVELGIPSKVAHVMSAKEGLKTSALKFPEGSHPVHNRWNIETTTRLPLRKQGRSKPEIMFLDEWRKIVSLDKVESRAIDLYETTGLRNVANIGIDYTGTAKNPYISSGDYMQGHFNDSVRDWAMAYVLEKTPENEQVFREWQKTNYRSGSEPGNSSLKDYRPEIVAYMPVFQFLARLCDLMDPSSCPLTAVGVPKVRGTRRWSTEGDIYVITPDNQDAVIELAEKTITWLATFMLDSIKDYQERVDRSLKFLADAVEKTGTRKETKPEGDYYHVPGKSGKTYIVHPDGKVSQPGRGHVCIVNGGVTDHFGYDYLVSVITALREDKYTARQISTLKV